MAITLTLGGVVFQDFEVPESINSGGEQALAIHKLPGGARVIDAMGPDDPDIRWNGRFRGPSAEARALLLDFFRRQGQQILLTYSLHRYQVVIRSFEANFQQSYEIPYSITCAVALDETQTVAQAAIGFIESVVSDAVSAAGLPSLIPNSAIATAVTGVGAAVNNYQAGVPNTTNALSGVTAASEGPLLNSLAGSISTAQSATQGAITTASSSLNPAPVAAGGSPSSMATALVNTGGAAGQLNTLYQLSSVLGRMAKNTANAGS